MVAAAAVVWVFVSVALAVTLVVVGRAIASIVPRPSQAELEAAGRPRKALDGLLGGQHATTTNQRLLK